MMKYKFCNSAKSRQIANTFGVCKRYIDDGLFINIGGFNPAEIYPNDLQLTVATLKTGGTLFLDLLVKYEDRLEILAYDKTDDFPFKVIKFGSENSNVSSHQGPTVFYSQTIWFARICTQESDFTHRMQLMFTTLVQLGYPQIKLEKTFLRFCENYNSLLHKYHIFNRKDVLRICVACFT
jgi:hypothetical protein